VTIEYWRNRNVNVTESVALQLWTAACYP